MRKSDALQQAELLATVGEASRGIMERAFAGKSSPRAAIKAKCLDCCDFDRAEVSACAVILCPLNAYRPYQIDKPRLRAARAKQPAQITPAPGAGVA